MRFIGHLDVMRYFQKAFRRADIALSYSQGFSPHQLMSFASPLGIGLSSDAEYLDIVLEDREDASTVLSRINAVMNEEITVKAFTVLKEDAKASMAVLAACDYLIAVKAGKDSFLRDVSKRQAALERFAGRETIEIMKKTKRSEQLVDIKENIYRLTDSKEKFEALTGVDYGASSLDTAEYLPVLYCQLTAGSVVNIKPELVLEALCTQEKEPYEPFSYQIHRLEMYADATAKKGEVHTLYSEIPCSLQPLSAFGIREEGLC
jgi:radical SAM-linked protein